MDRRSFLLTLFGGSIAVASGGALVVQPASSATLAPDAIEKLDATEAEFSQYRRHERPVRRGLRLTHTVGARDPIGATATGRRQVTIAAGTVATTADIAGDPSLRQRGMTEHFVS